MAVMDAFKEVYVMKGVGAPEYYLGGDLEHLDTHWTRENVGLALSSKTYIKNVVPKLELMCGHELRTYKTPMAEDLHPELDDSPFLDNDDAARFRSIIGSANWLITLGRFDISYATMSLGRFNMKPRQGHLTAAKRLVGYIKYANKGKVVFDVNHLDTSAYEVQDHDNWGEFYPDAKEEMPPGMPVPKGRAVRITTFVDADHAHDQVTRRSVTGIVMMVNKTPVRWYCKRQKTVETSTYGSELVAARIATELIIEVRYMLRMIGVPIDGPTLMLGDNMSVILNTTVPSSVLKKKHCAIGYHRVREAIAGGVLCFSHIKSVDNVADVMTKPLGGEAFRKLTKPWLFRVPVHLSEQAERDLRSNG
jgi:hypothetical protein